MDKNEISKLIKRLERRITNYQEIAYNAKSQTVIAYYQGKIDASLHTVIQLKNMQSDNL